MWKLRVPKATSAGAVSQKCGFEEALFLPEQSPAGQWCQTKACTRDRQSARSGGPKGPKGPRGPKGFLSSPRSNRGVSLAPSYEPRSGKGPKAQAVQPRGQHSQGSPLSWAPPGKLPAPTTPSGACPHAGHRVSHEHCCLVHTNVMQPRDSSRWESELQCAYGEGTGTDVAQSQLHLKFHWGN